MARQTYSRSGLHFLLRIASPCLPIGGFSYSAGLESAIHHDLVTTKDHAAQWICQGLTGIMSRCEGPIWWLLFHAFQKGDKDALMSWNEWYWASRDTLELRQETEQMGWSMRQLAEKLAWGSASERRLARCLRPPTFLAMHAYASAAHRVEPESGLWAFFFSWVENQTMAALKTIPLGQTDGQLLMAEAEPWIRQAIEISQHHAEKTPPEVFSAAPQLSILSSLHEVQYSRLFRS